MPPLPVPQQLALRRGQHVEPRGDERMQRAGHLQGSDVADDAVASAVDVEPASVGEHADRLDGVERHTFGAGDDARG